jgi:hypothetical protein
MLKLTSVALSLLTLVSIVPSAQAGLIFKGDSYNSQPTIKVIVNPQAKNQRRDEDCDEDRRNTKYNKSNSYKKYHERQAAQRRSEWEARSEAYRRTQRADKYYSNSSYHRDSYDRDDDYSSYNDRDRH